MRAVMQIVLLLGFAAFATLSPGQQPDEPAGAGQEAPQDLEPAVDTSAGPAGEAGEPAADTAPNPEALEPAVDTSDSASEGADTEAPRAEPSGTTTASGGEAPPARGGGAVDRIELDTTQITGNRELPKVLYIVPWKRAELGDLVGKPVNSLLDEVLEPVDRDVFRRENRYYRALRPDEAGSAGAASAGPER